MSNIADQILDAMEIMNDSKMSELRYDKTVLAKVYKIVNLDTGEYKVRYSGNIFSAFSEDTSKKYRVDDLVFVKIPESDFSARKIITSLVSARSLSYSLLLELLNSIFEVSPDFDTMYEYDSRAEHGVIAGVAPGEPNSYQYIYLGPEEYDPQDYHGLFQQYGSKYENIRITANFLTQFYSVHTQGNYGIEIEFYAKNDGVVRYRLDVSQFNGDPYGLPVYTPQSVVLKVQKNYLLGLKSIKLFEENFIPDKIVENGVITDKENLTVPNIFVKDISMEYVEVRDMSDDSYYLVISAPKGIAFTANIFSIDLIGRLMYQGLDLMDLSTCTCKWYERDLSVMIGNENYDKDAGFGWRLVDEDSETYSLIALDVPHTLRYKLVVIYQDKVNLSAEIEIYNRLSEYDFKLAQITQGDNIVLQIEKESGDEELVGDWYLGYPDGSYEAVPDGAQVNSINVTDYLNYSSVNFYCAIYTVSGTFLGTLEHTIMNSSSSEDVTITYEGEDLFRYDSNGDVTIEDSEKERTLLVNLAWKEGYGTSYTVEWLMGGVPIGTSKQTAISPPNSMIDNLWVDNYNILHYNIKCKYRVNFNNNTLTVRIRTITEEVYTFEKEILFLKDGDLGTNGTTYVAAIRPCDSSGAKLSGLHPLVYYDGWQGGLDLRCYVYKDGELINNDTANHTISFKWTGYNIAVNSSVDFPYEGSSLVTVSGETRITEQSSSKDLEFYVKVAVKILDRKHSKTIEIYASYPIDVAVGGIDYNLIDIDDIPSYIKYTSSGLTPSFYSNNLNYLYDGVSYNELISSLNLNILSIIDRDGGRYLEPAAQFLFENKDTESNIGVLSMRDPTGTTDGRRLIHPIIMYLDTYGNEAINGWDGTAIVCNEGEDHYIFAPQVGAGIKDNANRFSGVVMGEDSGQPMSSSETSRRYKIGLFGYLNGVNTFGLLEDGTAFFGAKSGGGLIVIDGRKATISGGNGGNSSTGMTITLADLNPGGNSSAIRVGNGVFEVRYDGSVTATSATITGTIYATEGIIGCNSSRNGGWTILTNRLYSGSGTTRVELNSDSSLSFAIWAGGNDPTVSTGSDNFELCSVPFGVTRRGKLYAREAVIRGTIVSGSGRIGGWTLASNKLTSANSTNRVGMASSGTLAFWAGPGFSSEENTSTENTNPTFFSVTRSGKLSCSSANVKGSITAESGKIGKWEITTSGLLKGSTTTGEIILDPSNGITVDGKGSAGKEFKVTLDGKMKANDADISGRIDATSGKIALWEIDDDGLHSSDKRIQFNPTIGIRVGGTEDKPNFLVDPRGNMTARAGYIGDWSLESSGLSYDTDSIYIKTTGFKFKDVFSVSATGVKITGEISATSGLIGGWTINEKYLSNGDFILGGDGYTGGNTISFGNNFSVDSKGVGTIGGWTFDGNGLHYDDMHWYTDGRFKVNDNFYVDALGNAHVSGVSATEVSIEHVGVIGYVNTGSGSVLGIQADSGVGAGIYSGRSITLEAAPRYDVYIEGSTINLKSGIVHLSNSGSVYVGLTVSSNYLVATKGDLSGFASSTDLSNLAKRVENLEKALSSSKS